MGSVWRDHLYNSLNAASFIKDSVNNNWSVVANDYFPEENTTVTGSLTSTLDSVSLAATGALAVTGNLTSTLDSVSLAATGSLAVTGNLTSTLDSVSLAATGSLAVTGSLTSTLDSVSLAATGSLAVTGNLTSTLDSVSLAATGSLAVTGNLTSILDSVSLAATAINYEVRPKIKRTYRLQVYNKSQHRVVALSKFNYTLYSNFKIKGILK